MSTSYELLDHYICIMYIIYNTHTCTHTCVCGCVCVRIIREGENLRTSKDRIYSEKAKKNNGFRNAAEDKSVAFWSGFGTNSGGEWKNKYWREWLFSLWGQNRNRRNMLRVLCMFYFLNICQRNNNENLNQWQCLLPFDLILDETVVGDVLVL